MKTFVFVSDLFVEDYVGGAELTTEALINKTTQGNKIIKIRSHEVTATHINNLKEHHWIICNFSNLSESNKLNICKAIDYSMFKKIFF